MEVASKSMKAAFVWVYSGKGIRGLLWKSLRLGSILIPDYFKKSSAHSAPE